MEDTIINRTPVVISKESNINDVVQKMVELKISSALVRDEENNIIGIITERDIVRRFTLLDVDDKLEKNVTTVMTRPLVCVQEKKLIDNIKKIYLAKRIRHFPVINGPEPTMNSLVGIVSITDFLGYYINKEKMAMKGKDEEKPDIETVKVALLAESRDKVPFYQVKFPNSGIEFQFINSFHSFVREEGPDKMPLIFDMDGFKQKDLSQLIPQLKFYKAPLMCCTSNPSLLAAFKKFLHSELQSLTLKPVDYRYWQWIIREVWFKQNNKKVD